MVVFKQIIVSNILLYTGKHIGKWYYVDGMSLYLVYMYTYILG